MPLESNNYKKLHNYSDKKEFEQIIQAKIHILESMNT